MADPKRIVIAGGGVAALEAALTLQALAGELVDVELLAPESRFRYRPLSTAEPFGLGEVASFELADLATRAGATFTLDAVNAVDSSARLAFTREGRVLEYDALLLACGTIPKTAVHGALTFRGPEDMQRVRALLDLVEASEVTHIVVTVPRGAVWTLPAYELALLFSVHAPQARARPRADHARHARGRAPPAVRRRRHRRDSHSARGAPHRAPDRLLGDGVRWNRAASASRTGRSRRTPSWRCRRSAGPGSTECHRLATGFVVTDASGRVDGRPRPVRGRRHHELPRQAGRDRHAAGGRRGGVHRSGGRRPDRARAVQAHPSRPTPDGCSATLSSPRHRRRWAWSSNDRAALVAADEARRPSARSVPGGACRNGAGHAVHRP